jgi:hypothetical protein
MDSTLQLIVLLAAAATALGVLFKKVILPSAQLIVETKRMLPFLQHLPILEDLKKVLPILVDIAAQFRTDSGSTLKDDINVLRQYAEENRDAAAASMTAAAESMTAAAEYARVNRALITEMQIAMAATEMRQKEAAQQLREDRDMMRDAVKALVRVEASGERVEASGARTEAADEVVASDLAAREKRADDMSGQAPGVASDAALQSGEEPDEQRP